MPCTTLVLVILGQHQGAPLFQSGRRACALDPTSLSLPRCSCPPPRFKSNPPSFRSPSSSLLPAGFALLPTVGAALYSTLRQQTDSVSERPGFPNLLLPHRPALGPPAHRPRPGGHRVPLLCSAHSSPSFPPLPSPPFPCSVGRLRPVGPPRAGMAPSRPRFLCSLH